MGNVRVDYSVEDGVPVPVEIASKSIPLGNLEVGQSILFPIERRAYVQTKASRLKKAENKVYTIRKVDTNHARVWRQE